MEITGIDLGTSQIKFVTLRKETKELLGFGATNTPNVPLESEAIGDIETYSRYLKNFLESQKIPPTLVSLSLPETKVFNRVITVPKMPEKDLKGAISFEAEQYLPLPLRDVVYDFKIIEDTEGGTKQNVMLVASPKELVSKYATIIKKAGLTLVGLESETAALARSVVDEAPGAAIATLIVNLGASATDTAIVHGSIVRFTRSTGTGGNALSRAVAQELGFELNQSEEYKKTYGLDETQLEGKITKALKPVFELIVDEIRRALAYYQTHQTASPPLKRLVLCGGTAALPGVLVYLASALNLEAQLANPWLKIKNSATFSKRELEEVGPLFAVAAGLALKDF